jgi:hypothetical protein
MEGVTLIGRRPEGTTWSREVNGASVKQSWLQSTAAKHDES